jgi:hypothetical protein
MTRLRLFYLSMPSSFYLTQDLVNLEPVLICIKKNRKSKKPGPADIIINMSWFVYLILNY